jgi:hypothetical protein
MAARRITKSSTASAAARGSGRAASARVGETVGPVLGEGVKNPAWLKPVRLSERLEPGQAPKQTVTVPVAEAQRILRGIIRFVVDIPADTSTVVVWEQDGCELWLDAGTVSMACTEGLVRVGVQVGCDQLKEPVVLTVPIGVGTSKSPAGLVMTTVARLEGPDLLVARWSDAVTAFGWEALVELARRLCAELGKDKAGLPLIPGAIAATRGALLIQPMSRNDLSALGR